MMVSLNGKTRFARRSSDWRQLERFKTAVEQVAIQIDATLQELHIGSPQIGNEALAKTGFQDGHAALDPETFSLRELARAEVVKDDEVGSDLLRQNERAEFADAKTE